MKHFDPKKQKKKNFLKMPSFPGGKEAYLEFLKNNIIYPEKALQNKVEGPVFITYTVNNLGDIEDVEVTKGIGWGCDEEAERVIRLLKYDPARNRGVRMTVEMKTRINFHLPVPSENIQSGNIQINYTSNTEQKTNSQEQKPQTVYNYTININ